MEPNTSPITDQLANISPIWIVTVVLVLTLIRVALSRSKDNSARTASEICDTVNFVLILAFLLIRPFVAQAFYIPSESMEYTLLKRDRLIVDKFSYRVVNPERRDVIVFEAPPIAMDGQTGIDFIKRLVAKEGDTVQVKPAKLVIDGEVIDPAAYGMPHLHQYLRERLSLQSETSIKLSPEGLLVGGKEKISKERLAEMLGQPGRKVDIQPGLLYVNGQPQDEPFTREDPDYEYPEGGGTRRLETGEFFMLGDNRNFSRDSHVWGPLDKRRVVGRARVLFWPPNRMGLIR